MSTTDSDATETDRCKRCGGFLSADRETIEPYCEDCEDEYETTTVYRHECEQNLDGCGGLLRERRGFARLDAEKHTDGHDNGVVAYEAVNRRGTRRYDLLREVDDE